MHIILKAKVYNRIVTTKAKFDDDDFAELLYTIQDFLRGLGYDSDVIEKHIKPEIFPDG